MNERLYEGFVRQRRNLMVMSVILLLVESAGVKFTELNLLGNTLLIENPNVINIGLWIGFAYWLYRYYVYFYEMGEKGFVGKYRVRVMRLVASLAFKQLKRDAARMDALIKAGKTKVRLGNQHNFYRQHPWFYEIKLHVIASLPKKEDDNAESLVVDHLFVDHFVVSTPFPLAVAHVRAWGHVLVRTRLSSEYLLPFALAALPVGYLLLHHLRII